MSSFGRFAKWCEFGLGRAATPADCAVAIRSAIEDEQPRFRYPVGPDAEDYWRAYLAVNDPEEWMRIACLDNAAYAAKMAELMGVDYYAEATIAVVPSLYEGFGLPAGEAMSCGVPLVSTSAGALPGGLGNSRTQTAGTMPSRTARPCAPCAAGPGAATSP